MSETSDGWLALRGATGNPEGRPRQAGNFEMSSFLIHNLPNEPGFRLRLNKSLDVAILVGRF